MFKDVGAWYIIEIYEIKSIEIENSMSDIWVNKHDISLKENILYSIYIHINHHYQWTNGACRYFVCVFVRALYVPHYTDCNIIIVSINLTVKMHDNIMHIHMYA